MSHRSRLLAAGLSAAVAGVALVAAPSPAGATTSKSFAYSCSGLVTAMSSPPLIPGFPPLPPLPQLTPVNATVALTVILPETPALGALSPGQNVPSIPVTGSLAVGEVLTAMKGLTGIGAAISTPLSGTGISLRLVLETELVAMGDVSAGLLPVAGSIPAFAAPTTPDAYPVSVPVRFDLSLPYEMSGYTGTNILTCTLPTSVTAAQRVLTTLGVVEPAVGTGRGPVVGTTAPPAVDASRSNPCVATPAAKAGQRATRMRATTVKRSWKKRPAIKLTVKAKRKAARGTVIACYGAMKVGQKKLRRGKATLKTVRFYPGRYHVKLVYLGSAKARPKARGIIVRVRR